MNIYKDIELRPISEEAQRRAKGADPEGPRCVIQNCTTSGHAVHQVHAFNRDFTKNGYIMSALEWSWGLERGTLNLDTSRNIFHLSAGLHELYLQRKWALLPEEWVVREYFGKTGSLPLRRKSFPIVAEKTFKYRFLALQDMEHSWFSRSNSYPPTPDGIATHMYPFDTLPIIESRIHPTFVIAHLGYVLSIPMKPGVRRSLGEKYPTLDDIITLYAVWVSDPPQSSSRDPTYITRSAKKHAEKVVHTDDLSDDDDNDSVCTLPRRIKSYKSTTPTRSPQIKKRDEVAEGHQKQRADSDNADRSDLSKWPALNADMTLEEKQELTGSGWTSDEISCWVDGCSNSNSITGID